MTPQEYRAKQNQLMAMTDETLVLEADRLAYQPLHVYSINRTELLMTIAEIAHRFIPSTYADLENRAGIYAGIRE